MTSNPSQSIRVGMFFLMGMALIWIVYETFSESNLYSDYGYSVKAPFENLKQLKSGSDVRMAGVSIGAVTDTYLEGDKAIAVLNIEPDFTIPRDSIAKITTAGLLGNNYVSIQLGDAKSYLEQGDSIKTHETADINAVISEVSEISKKIRKVIGDLTEENGKFDLFGGIIELVARNRPKVDQTIDNLRDLTNSLVNGDGTLAKLINEEDAYKGIVNATEDIKVAAQEARRLVSSAYGLVESVENGEGALGVLLKDESVAEELRKSVANINEFSEKLNSADGSLGKLIMSDELYEEARIAMKKVDTAIQSVENSGPMTAVGMAAGALF